MMEFLSGTRHRAHREYWRSKLALQAIAASAIVLATMTANPIRSPVFQAPRQVCSTPRHRASTAANTQAMRMSVRSLDSRDCKYSASSCGANRRFEGPRSISAA